MMGCLLEFSFLFEGVYLDILGDFMQGCTLDSSEGRPNFDIFNHCGKLGKIVILEHFYSLS